MPINNLSQKPPKKHLLLGMFKSSALGWLQLFRDLLLPAIYILAGALLYAELDAIMDKNLHSPSEIFVALGDDIMSNPILFVAFLIVLFLWILIKFFRKDPMEKKLDKLNEKIDILIQRGENNGGKPKSSQQ